MAQVKRAPLYTHIIPKHHTYRLTEIEALMYTDIFGKKRYKINLHTHTTVSDGRRTPEEVARIYREEGYDAVALTDHWKFGSEGEIDGLKIISGVEYNLPDEDTRTGLFHVVAIGMERDPHIPNDRTVTEQNLIDVIHSVGGLAILAHPAWSLNTPDQILKLHGFDATEIYNSVSEAHMSRRPDSSLIIDMIGAQGCLMPLLAVDDAHYYDGDACRGFIMLEADSLDQKDIVNAVREGKFYASQGPEVHLLREGDELVVKCSPASEIVFFSDAVWTPRVFVGEGLTEARYTPRSHETFIRAEVTDKDGKRAWTCPIKLEEGSV